ncbi:hypothetical protein LCGC14_1182380 [marine sediment metagenome]|uniref:Uncharacterized protein n=1 Tax=marine sediment metagenome TaxID=412755 RepID=A0A0F9LLT5_9ZZZZ
MSTVIEILSETDEGNILRNNLHNIGLYETLCFTLTNDQEWWFMEDRALIYSAWNDVGGCEIIITYWEI